MAFIQPDSYQRILSYVRSYEDAITVKHQQGIATDDPEKDVCAVLMEKWDVARLLFHPKCHKVAAFIGIDDGWHVDGNKREPRVTIALLAVDINNKVLVEHYKPEPGELQLQGEEVWPRRITIGELASFLPGYSK